MALEERDTVLRQIDFDEVIMSRGSLISSISTSHESYTRSERRRGEILRKVDINCTLFHVTPALNPFGVIASHLAISLPCFQTRDTHILPLNLPNPSLPILNFNAKLSTYAFNGRFFVYETRLR